MEAWTPEHWRKFLEKEVGPELGGAKDVMEDSMERKACVLKMYEARNKAEEKATVEEVKEWLRKYPIRNECTHYSCIMDPSEPGGGLVWVETCEAEYFAHCIL
ncbi:hypothetical protein NLJ89_g11802 [Agrocybe chaxingu]|uniref:Uncharacterized protein n=1 Tax=Agrocybe chaxingu TaxID=84603 RepID=A0A9W8MP24_9AGAR|nr:hypothetical protein NLJ89_g11802 [Agrocybe chaxingu]